MPLTLHPDEYYPRNIDLSEPASEHVYEFLVMGNDMIGVLAKLASIFSSHHANLGVFTGHLDATKKIFAETIYADFSKADCTADQVYREIRNLPFVTEVRYAGTKGRMFDRFFFPVTLMERFRAVVVRAEPLMRIEKRLAERMGSAASSIMFEEGRYYASEVLKEYGEVIEVSDTENFFENVKDGLRATGWGVFEFRKREDGGFRVVIKEPLYAGLEDVKESRFMYGIVAGILEKVYGGVFEVLKQEYAPEKRFVSLILGKRSGGAQRGVSER